MSTPAQPHRRLTATERGLPPIPWGWFVVGISAELARGELRTLRYFDRDLVLFRTDSGVAQLWDAHCPHLGAHLGFGGEVKGETLQCPFHNWRFDTRGQCVEVPNCDRIPPNAKTTPWTIVEQNGAILAWFHPDGVAPSFEVEAMPDEGWTDCRVVQWDVRSHPQEIGENTVDTGHMKPVHHTGNSRVRSGPILSGATMKVDLYFLASGEIIGFEGENDVELDVTMYGLGYIEAQANITNVGLRARYRICCTPLDRDRIHIFGIVNMKETGDPEYTQEVFGLFFDALTKDFVKDFDIWENKIYRPRPTLSKVDGPIGAYRRFAKQFYLDEGSAQPEAADRVHGAEPVERPAVRPTGSRSPRERAMGALVSAHGLLSRVRGFVDDLRGDTADEGGDRAEVSARVDDIPSSVEPAASPTPQATAPAQTGSSARMKVQSAAHYFETLPQRFEPKGAEGIDAVFQWELAGEGGGQYHAIVKDGRMQLVPGPHEGPTVTLSIDAKEYVKVINGELDGTRAFTVGSGKVRGKLRMAMRMQQIFPQ